GERPTSHRPNRPNPQEQARNNHTKSPSSPVRTSARFLASRPTVGKRGVLLKVQPHRPRPDVGHHSASDTQRQTYSANNLSTHAEARISDGRKVSALILSRIRHTAPQTDPELLTPAADPHVVTVLTGAKASAVIPVAAPAR